MTAQLSRVRLEAAIGALKFLAEKPRPIYGESLYNTAHLYQIAAELERMLDAPAPVAVPDEKWVNPDIGYADENGFAEGWNESRQYAIAKGVIPPVVKGISEHCRGWNAFGAAMRKAELLKEATVPDGWKLVPVEPTEGMLRAAWKQHAIHHPSCYRTMVLEAPTPEEHNANA